VLLIPVLVLPVVEDLSRPALAALRWLGFVIWLAFALEFLIVLALSTDRQLTLRTHKLDLALVLLPFLQPLRIAQLARLAHAGTAVARALGALRRMFGRPGFGIIIATVGGLIVAGGALVTIAEHGQPGSNIENFTDGLWWAFVTCTTVGYGDRFPITGSGRVIAAMLMLAGIGGLSVITANIAAYFVSNDTEEEVDELEDRLEDRLTTIEGQLQELLQRTAPDAR